jgi:hypothetical protein
MKHETLTLRSMMKISDMVPYLKNKNIKFDCCLEQDAETYLRENNNYYNVTSYKNNFVKYQCGELEGKYIDLDFAYLKDLSIIKRLKKLSLSNTEILTSEYLIYMNDIEYLSINGTGIKSISNLVHFDKLKLLVIDGSQAINNKELVMMMINNGIDVVDPSNRSVVSYYE